ncbi:MAG: tetratricopeptide repeat protein [Deltaproteobacteria bacterium]|nr:MAG: tetratricopeptide repeat protein [Deltaproteobacteria bacterium]
MHRTIAASISSLLLTLILGATAHAQNQEQRAAEEAIAAWDITTAEQLVAQLNAEAPQDPRNLFLTGHLHLMKGEYQQAVDYLGQAEHASGDPLASHYFELAKAVLEETQDYAHHLTADGNFLISYPKGADAVLVPYAEATMAKAWKSLTKIFDYVPERPVRIEFYPTVDVLGHVSPLTVAEIRTSGTIALCKYNRLMVTSPRDLVYGYDWLDTLSHEFIHLLITKKSKNQVPIWLHEGLAKYYEVKWRDVPPTLERHSEALLAKAIADDKLITFEEMSPSMAKLPSQEATATAFAEVFTVIEFLNKRHGADVAAPLVASMAGGESDRDAVSAVAGMPFDRFGRAWKAFLKGQGYRPRDVEYDQRLLFKGEHSEQDELAQLKVDKAKELVWLGDRLRLKKRWRAASKEYRRATEFVGDKSPLVQGKLGLALLRTGLFEQAATELQKPIDLYPRHVVLQVYLGEALLKMGRYEEARTHLEEALTINPFDPDVHASLAIVYDQLGEHDRAAVEKKANTLVNAM